MEYQDICKMIMQETNELSTPIWDTVQKLERQLLSLNNGLKEEDSLLLGEISKVFYPENLQKYQELVKQNKFQLIMLPDIYRKAIDHYLLVCEHQGI